MNRHPQLYYVRFTGEMGAGDTGKTVVKSPVTGEKP